jgi:hypothetical protein
MNGNTYCVREIRTALEREAYQMREGLIAFEQGYNLTTVLSLSKVAQETYWKLKNGEED